jgi:hypothetical protein
VRPGRALANVLKGTQHICTARTEASAAALWCQPRLLEAAAALPGKLNHPYRLECLSSHHSSARLLICPPALYTAAAKGCAANKINSACVDQEGKHPQKDQSRVPPQTALAPQSHVKNTKKLYTQLRSVLLQCRCACWQQLHCYPQACICPPVLSTAAVECCT